MTMVHTVASEALEWQNLVSWPGSAHTTAEGSLILGLFFLTIIPYTHMHTYTHTCMVQGESSETPCSVERQVKEQCPYTGGHSFLQPFQIRYSHFYSFDFTFPMLVLFL